MKRLILVSAAIALFLTGCGSKSRQQDISLPDNAAEATVPAETETTPPRPIAERAAELQSAGDTHIFDEQGVLSDEEKEQYNNYLEWLANIRQIRAAAVITNQLGGKTPEDFSAEYYHTLFGTAPNGFLLLINNDTNRDYVYCEGACKTYISSDLAIAKATPYLIEQKYADALEILLPVGEMVPDRVLDRCGALTPEQVEELRALADPGDSRYCVLFTKEAPSAEGVTEAVPTETEAPDTAEPEAASDETSAPDNAEADAPETAETGDPDAETTAAGSPAPEPAPAELKTFADDVCRQNEADRLLVIDAAHSFAWIAGKEDEALSAEIQAVLRTDGAFAAAKLYYERVLP